jgi:NTP pyrophosphatase (non-canonical NTP hydrolase)
MNSETYERAAERTIDPALDKTGNMVNAAFGLAGESGEIADHIKKYLFHGHTLDRYHILKELGDIQWYIVQMCHALDLTLDEVMVTNITKLEERYKDGFTHRASINRSNADVS